uniref:Transmembrane protein 19 n=1 Tax=Caligus rogercresseyi TaxID=217165 RepID=C1BPY2_CALRO|nr:Transmembrane protein 19 [Caligus rogercresseyi]
MKSMAGVHPVVGFFSLFYGLLSVGSLYIIFSDIRSGSLLREPFRLPFSLCVTLFIVYRSLRKKRLSLSGAPASFPVGFLHFYASPAFTGALLAFFLSSSFATRYREGAKKNISGSEFKEGGQRNWVQVMCNGLVSSTGALFFLLGQHRDETPIGTTGLAVLLANAACCGDTWASELGQVLSSGDPVHILNLQRVPRGTNGGVSVPGVLISFLGGLWVGLNFLWPLCLFHSLSSWTCLVLLCTGAAGGLFGSLLDSILGGLLQYSGIDSSGAIHQSSGPGVTKICGWEILDNDSVNILSTLITTLLISNSVTPWIK